MDTGTRTETNTTVADRSNMNVLVRVAVGSTNPVKVRAARQGVAAALQLVADSSDCVQATGFATESRVPDQPKGDPQTKLGAVNRAKAAYSAFYTANGTYPDYAVGLEGGVRVIEVDSSDNSSDNNSGTPARDLECFAWMAVFDGNKVGAARSASFILPRAISRLVLEQGMELGAADDTVFGTKNAKQGDGTVGHLTRNVIDRTRYYEMAVTLAMIPFLNNDLYPVGRVE
jgi:inosine/xanthosine triphosphatase